MSVRFAQANLGDEWTGMMAATNPSTRQSLMAGTLSPLDLLRRHAISRAAWYVQNKPMTVLEFAERVRHEGLSDAWARANAQMPPAPGLQTASLLWEHLQTTRQHHPHVLVIGAGAAGLAAAEVLHQRGLQVTVIEQAERVGGRTYTDTQRFNMPLDLGAEHLHSGATNPMTALAEKMGFTTLAAAPEPGLAFFGTAGENPRANGQALWATRQSIINELDQLQPDMDCAVGDVLSPPSGPWAATAMAQIGPLEMGVELSNLSTQDMRHIMPERNGDLYVAEGIGTMISCLSWGLVVHRGAAAQEIHWTPEGATVCTTRGVYQASHVIITASTGVLSAGTIRFVPELPPWKTAALQRVPMAHYEKIILQFSKDIFPQLEPATYAQVQCTPENPMDFFIKPPMAYRDQARVVVMGYVGATFAHSRADRPDADMIDYALSQLQTAFGLCVRHHFIDGMVTHWEHSHGGAYTAAQPGHYDARQVVAKPVSNVLFFAGEACESPWATQVPGAFLSGQGVGHTVSALYQNP